jgi:CubicO group peptidase (beta-lactamase class C family)
MLLLTLATSATVLAEIRQSDCVEAARYFQKTRGVSMLVMQHGRIVFEDYPTPEMEAGRWPIFSGTKNFWGVAALCAVRDGLIRLDERVADTITEWKSDPLKSQITIRELLNQTSGLDSASFLHRQSIADRNASALRLPMFASPGTRFIYGPSHLQVFCELLRRKLGGRSTISYLKHSVTGPLGLTGLEFKKDRRGNPLPASGFELTAREWARLGELILGGGNYHGRQVVPGLLLREAFLGSSVNPSYGLTFWLNRQAPRAPEIDFEKELDLDWQRAHWIDICICGSAPPDMIACIGSGYQRMFVIPSMDAIIVRLGQNTRFSDARFLRLLLGR